MSSNDRSRESAVGVPAELRDAIEHELRPVRPLRPCWRRLLYALPVVMLALGLPLVVFTLRDLGDFGMILGWLPVGVQILLAMALLVFALREGIPGSRISSTMIFTVCLAAYALQILVNLGIYLSGPMAVSGASVGMWMQCFRIESLIGVPVLVAIAWLVGRSLPERPLLAGFLAGTGAGFAGDASWRLVCTASSPMHVLLGHTGGILVLGLTGFLLGYVWSLYTRRTA